jgi:hypothetical protein
VKVKLIETRTTYFHDTSLLEVVDDPDVTAAKLNDDLELINTWTHKWLVTINFEKTKSMVFSTKRQNTAKNHFLILRKKKLVLRNFS